jgi:hypothetical protein
MAFLPDTSLDAAKNLQVFRIESANPRHFGIRFA